MNKCHVIVLMNQMPDLNKLTNDRYDILEVRDYKDVLPSAERPAKRQRPNVTLPTVPETPPLQTDDEVEAETERSCIWFCARRTNTASLNALSEA